jgi:type IV pilus assembly protein PilE
MSRIPRHQSGFTLMELMIVVAIIAILSAIAIPQYQAYITRSKLTEATSNLSSVRAAMEQYYQDNRAYVCPSATPTTPPSPAQPTMNYFQFVCTLAPDANGIADQAYTLTANGNAATSVAGFSFSINNLNNKWSNAADGVVQQCWVNSAKGGC